MTTIELPRGIMNTDLGPVVKKAHPRDPYSWRSQDAIRKSSQARKTLPRKVKTLADVVAEREQA